MRGIFLKPSPPDTQLPSPSFEFGTRLQCNNAILYDHSSASRWKRLNSPKLQFQQQKLSKTLPKDCALDSHPSHSQILSSTRTLLYDSSKREMGETSSP